MRFVYTYNKSASKPGDSRGILAPQRNVLWVLPGTTRNPDLAGRITVISATFPEKTQERLDSFPAPGLPHPERVVARVVACGYQKTESSIGEIPTLPNNAQNAMAGQGYCDEFGENH